MAARRQRLRGRADAAGRPHTARGRRCVLSARCGRGAPGAQRVRRAGALRDAVVVGGRGLRRHPPGQQHRVDRRSRVPPHRAARRGSRLLGARAVSEVNVFGVAVTKDPDDPDGYDCSYARIGPLVGGRLLGLSVYELPPGQSICPYHYEIGFEEWLFVLTGRPTLRTPDGERELRPWDVAFFPDGEAGGPQGTKHTPQRLRGADHPAKG